MKTKDLPVTDPIVQVKALKGQLKLLRQSAFPDDILLDANVADALRVLQRIIGNLYRCRTGPLYPRLPEISSNEDE